MSNSVSANQSNTLTTREPGNPTHASSQINNRRQSIASRLLQFATGVSGNLTPSSMSPQSDPLSSSPSYQSVQMTQQESYSRLREHLFPSSTPTGPFLDQSVMNSTTGPGFMIPNQRSTRSGASSRFQQIVQSALLNNPHRLADRLVNRETHQNLSPNHGFRANAARQNGRNQLAATMHPSFRSKAVCQLGCTFCTMEICKRGMRAILLADTSVELYSTDDVSKGRVQLVGDDYLTENCQCRIRDVACLGCGNVVGYHVTQPCELCLNSCNNGHFWMFLSDYVKAKERLDASGQRALVWAHLLDHQEVNETVYR